MMVHPLPCACVYLRVSGRLCCVCLCLCVPVWVLVDAHIVFLKHFFRFFQVTKHILAPEEEGTHTVTLTVAGSYLPSTIHHLPIVATEPRTGMAHYRN